MPTQKIFVHDLPHAAEREVAERVRSLEGVIYAAANHEDQCVEVEFEDDAVTPEEICKAIRALGYRAEPAG